mmetsp:Transcript_20462/g.50145  ORF Transcript_20462/g.50145 Transcript_20462/m.50145 type:complete len:445 (+) Transcript_20462:271-1605(+)
MTMSKKSKHGFSLRQKSAARPETGVKMLGNSHSSSTDDTDLESQQYESNSTTTLSGKKNAPGERLQRSRERNRIHARKTRQRKKEQMQNLQKRAGELKQEQIRLKQSINEKATASILVGLFSKDSSLEQLEDPRVEELLRRPIDEIPDASKLPELPALILPGQHNSKKHKSSEAITSKNEVPNDGIDYDLLGKDRSKCTPAELDQIRRERNRMHAKRTRDRKRLFMEEMAEMCSRLEQENKLLNSHLGGISGLKQSSETPELSMETPAFGKDRSKCTPAELDQIRRERNRMHAKRTRDRKRLFMEEMAEMCSRLEQENKLLNSHLGGISGLKQSSETPELSMETPAVTPLHMEETMSSSCMTSPKSKLSNHGVTLDQIKTLLEAAGTFTNTLSTSLASASVSASEGGSLSDQDDSYSSRKRRKLDATDVPQSITATSPPTAVGV